MIKKTHRLDIVFGFVFFFFMILNYGLKSSALVYPELVNDLILVTTLAMAVVSLCCHYYSVAELLLIALVLGLGVINFLFSRLTDFFMIMLGMAVASYMPIKRLLKLYFWEKLGIFCVVFLLSVCGIIPAVAENVWKGDHAISVYSFGFETGNRLTLHAFVLVMLFNLTYRKRKFWTATLAVELAIVLVLYNLSGSRAGLLFGTLGVLLMVLGERVEPIRKNVFRYRRLLLLALVVGAYLLIALVQDIKFIRWIDVKLFNNRLVLASYYFEAYDISLLGQILDLSVVEKISNYYYVLDNGFGYDLIYYGAIPVITLFLLIIYGVGKWKEPNRYLQIVSIFLLLAWSMYESAALTFEVNFALIFAGAALRIDKKSKKSNKLSRRRNYDS